MGYCGNTNTPSLDNDPLGCSRYEDTNCILYQAALPYFGFTTASTVTQIIDATIVNLQDYGTRLAAIEEDLGNGTIVKTHTSDLINDGEDGSAPYLTNFDFKNFIEGTYDEVKALRDAGELTPGFRYIITDYQTKYFIKGSNSSGVVEYKEITSYISGWAVLDNDYEYELAVGMSVEITELPDGYSGGLSVGDTTTVSSQSVDYYWKFANGMQSIIGLKFKFYYDRYTTLPQDSIVLDNNGKVVMQPQGLINTDVHDGTPYMDQTGAENYAPPMERIVLEAASTNSFKSIGYSDTFEGDIIHYDMDDSDIINDNVETIGTRPGLIFRRETFDGKINIGVDWKAVRYRRWLIDSDSRLKFLNEFITTNTKTRHTTSGYFLYHSNVRTVNSTNAFYIAKDLEGSFLTLNSNAQVQDYNYTVESNINCKDLSPFPIDNSYNPVDVTGLKVTGSYNNTVFLGIAGEFDYSLLFDTTGDLLDNTFVSHFYAISVTEGVNFKSCTFLDSVYFNQASDLIFSEIQQNAFVLYVNTSNSSMFRSIFGGFGENERINGMGSTSSWIGIHSMMGNYMYESSIGGKNVYLNINKSRIIRSSLWLGDANPSSGGSLSQETQPEVMNFNSSVLTNVVLHFLAPCGRVTMNDWMFPISNTYTGNLDNLFVYTTEATKSRMNLRLNRYSFNLFRHDVDASDVITIANEFTPQ